MDSAIHLRTTGPRDFLDDIEIKENRSIFYKDKIVYKKVKGKYVISRDSRSVEYIREFRQQIQDVNTDSLEKISSDKQKVEQLVTVNTVNQSFLENIPVEISERPVIKGIIDNALNLDVGKPVSPETIKELENSTKDIRDELRRADSEDIETRKYHRKPIDYMENMVDISLLRDGLNTRYNNLETDYRRLRRLKDFLKRNFGIVAFITTVVGGTAGLVITIISFVRSSVSTASRSASNAGKGIWDFSKKVGAILAPILTALATLLSWTVSFLAWMASNLWVLLLIVFGIIYDVLKKKKHI